MTTRSQIHRNYWKIAYNMWALHGYAGLEAALKIFLRNEIRGHSLKIVLTCVVRLVAGLNLEPRNGTLPTVASTIPTILAPFGSHINDVVCLKEGSLSF